jgi:hypothetical protein
MTPVSGKPIRRRVFMFKPRFAALVRSGRKHQTIRPVPKPRAMPRVGDIADLREWSGKPYRSKQTKIDQGEIYEIMHITIRPDGSVWWHHHNNDWRLEDFMVGHIARLDGFRTIAEFLEFFRESYGLPFEGVLFRWR